MEPPSCRAGGRQAGRQAARTRRQAMQGAWGKAARRLTSSALWRQQLPSFHSPTVHTPYTHIKSTRAGSWNLRPAHRLHGPTCSTRAPPDLTWRASMAAVMYSSWLYPLTRSAATLQGARRARGVNQCEGRRSKEVPQGSRQEGARAEVGLTLRAPGPARQAATRRGGRRL